MGAPPPQLLICRGRSLLESKRTPFAAALAQDELRRPTLVVLRGQFSGSGPLVAAFMAVLAILSQERHKPPESPSSGE